jgi:hypothetical protein
MNQIPKRDKYAEEIARIREIVGRHALPEFVTGFDVRLGEFDGDPAMWITFHTTEAGSDAELNRQVAEVATLRQKVQTDLLEAFEDRFPYFRID